VFDTDRDLGFESRSSYWRSSILFCVVLQV